MTFLSTRDQRRDALAAAIACGVSFAVYCYTVAPCITLQDAGEEVTAAQLFGVPHPPGYPLWTFLAWLFHLLLPFGNAAWKINLFSGVCGALAVGCTAWLISHSLRWFITPEEGEPGAADSNIAFTIAVSFSLSLAFSVSMWSQAVITEVYTLHSLLTALYLTSLYLWIRDPSRLGKLVVTVFLFALGMSNHHLMISLVILPVGAVLLLRRDFLAELFVFMALAGGSVYLGFARLSGEIATWNTAVRFLWCALAGLIALIWIKRRRLRWRTGLCFLIVPLGLLPYIYMPLASSTNPPMNWGYTRDPSGFFYAINRSQYQGPLSSQILRTLGKAMGSAPPDLAWEQQQSNPTPMLPQKSRVSSIMTFAGQYWIDLCRSFSFVPVIGFLFGVLAMFRPSTGKRAWVFLLFIGFFLAAFLQPFFDEARIDVAGWDLQMPYHGYAYLIFTVLAATGFSSLAMPAVRLFRSHRWIYALFLMPVYGLIHNRAESSQRDHWFGWQYGEDMLHDLPKESIIFGGTDPGRFVPTYMIFGESSQPAKAKRDPNFDRRDLYIITQNTLGDPFYLKYLRDQYSPSRPAGYNAFEKWLGRDSTYPKDTIAMPTDEEMRGIVKKIVDDRQKKGEPLTDIGMAMNGTVAQWIFDHNKKEHDFFVEESFPMEWSYPYAVPAGLVYRLNSEAIDKIPDADVEADRAFWKKYTAGLLANPRYAEDIDAQRSFSKLRTTSGNLYRFRGLMSEAEAAYRQALELWPANTEAIGALLRIFTEQKRFDEGIALMETSYPLDPHSQTMQQMTAGAFLRKQLQGDIESAEQALHADPKNRDLIRKLLRDYESVDDKEAADDLIARSMKDLPDDTMLLQDFINHYVLAVRFDKALELAQKWDQLEPENPEVKFMLTKFFFITGQRDDFYKNAQKAIALGGVSMRERYAREPVFGPVRSEPEFQALVKTNSVPAAAPAVPIAPSVRAN